MRSLRRIPVHLGRRSYDIVVAGDYVRLVPEIKRLGLGRRGFVLTDRHVGPLYGRIIASALRRAGLEIRGAVIPAGERQKSLRMLEWLLERLLDAGLKRGDTLFALGGGVIGDLGGFAAATYHRGIALVHLPTTLLAMVDSSIGGKTGVNLARGKNLVGAFHQPRLVYTAVGTLLSLPPREFRSGLAEVIKVGMVADRRLFDLLEGTLEEILHLRPAPLVSAIERAVAAKARIVAEDELDQGRRHLLNYGHTVGHAIEAATKYRRFTHGEAVALGMAAAAAAAQVLGVGSPATRDRQNLLLARAGLPLRARGLPTAEILSKLYFDKKIKSKGIRLVLTSRIGFASVHESLLQSDLFRAISSVTMG